MSKPSIEFKSFSVASLGPTIDYGKARKVTISVGIAVNDGAKMDIILTGSRAERVINCMQENAIAQIAATGFRNDDYVLGDANIAPPPEVDDELAQRLKDPDFAANVRTLLDTPSE